MRAQAAELRQLKAAGLLGASSAAAAAGVRSTASPRPVAYTVPDAEAGGELSFRPFPAAFKPVKAHPEPPAAVAVAAARAAQRRAAGGPGSARGNPVPPVLGGAGGSGE